MATAGRQKIELKLIENEKDRTVTLSKRHEGIFKKAGEFATRCGAEIAIILFTISGKPLSFGSPCVASVKKKFLGSNHGDNELDAIESSGDSIRKAEIEEFNDEFDEYNERFALAKKLGQKFEKEVKMLLGGKTYEDFKSSMEIDQLMQMKYELEHLKKYLQHGSNEESGSSSFKDDYEPDLSKVEGPRDYLKL